jgi:hypothetical protein
MPTNLPFPSYHHILQAVKVKPPCYQALLKASGLGLQYICILG